MTGEEENLPETQQVSDVVWSLSQPRTVWGRLFSMQEKVSSFDLINDTYTFGRDTSCDVVFDSETVNRPWVKIISKIHFKIMKETLIGSDGYHQCIVFLQDMSQNGTYVNSKRVEKGTKVKLRNDDVIAMSEPNKLKVFIFMDEDGLESSDFPVEVTRKYTLSRTLGTGACGEVKMAFSKDSQRKVAIKIISKKQIDYVESTSDKDSKRIHNEIEILRKLQHPSIINMLDFIDTPHNIFIVLELMEGGELLERIKRRNRISERHTKILFYQVALAVEYLHIQGIAHRDLKPENILLASDDDETLVKLTDFGLSKITNASMMKTFCGTPMYVAPEILLNGGRGVYTNQVDIWSMGVILYCCLSGLTPFSSKKTIPLPEQIMKGLYTFPSFFSGVSSNAINMIKQMMTVNPQKRIKINEIINHSWFVDRTMQQMVKKLFMQYGSDIAHISPFSDDAERELQYRVKRARISSDDDIS